MKKVNFVLAIVAFVTLANPLAGQMDQYNFLTTAALATVTLADTAETGMNIVKVWPYNNPFQVEKTTIRHEMGTEVWYEVQCYFWLFYRGKVRVEWNVSVAILPWNANSDGGRLFSTNLDAGVGRKLTNKEKKLISQGILYLLIESKM